jgi:hypothetical protein
MMRPLYLTGLVLMLISSSAFAQDHQGHQTQDPSEHDVHTCAQSPYAGQEMRAIKALSSEDVQALLAGSGMAYGGLAKSAELNGYPGMRHLLEMANEIDLTPDQTVRLEAMFAQMRDEAIVLGEAIIAVETQIDQSFSGEDVNRHTLQAQLGQSANLQGQLRFVHLSYHLETIHVLNEEQVDLYNRLRGYTGSQNPCDIVPEGHNADLWRQNNNCN